MFLFGKKNNNPEPMTTHNLGGCIVTKSLLEGTSNLKWISREAVT